MPEFIEIVCQKCGEKTKVPQVKSKKAAYALFLATLLLLWLFVLSTLIIWMVKLIVEQGKFEIFTSRYTVFPGPTDSEPTILINQATGDSWRYFRNMKGGKIEAEGWIAMDYYGFSRAPRFAIPAWMLSEDWEEKLKTIGRRRGQGQPPLETPVADLPPPASAR